MLTVKFISKQLFIAAVSLITICPTGCKKNNKEHGAAPMFTDSMELPVGDTLASFDEIHPVGLAMHQNSVLLQLMESEDQFVVLDLHDADKKLASIKRGQGPNDVVEGSILKTPGSQLPNEYKVYDGNVEKEIVITETGDSVSIKSISNKVPHWVSELHYADDFTVGHRMGKADMFNVWSKEGDITASVEYPLVMNEELTKKIGPNKEYLMSFCLAVNPERDRIMAFSYFFNYIAVYDFKGNLIASFGNPDISSAIEKRMASGEFSGYTQPFATPEACYVIVRQYEEENPVAQYLAKFDWDGKLIKSYSVPLTDGSYTVLDNGQVVFIASSVKDDNEIFSLVKYNLN